MCSTLIAQAVVAAEPEKVKKEYRRAERNVSGFLKPELPNPDIPDTPPIPLRPNTLSATAAAVAAQKARAQRLKGQSSTILTGPLGLSSKALTSQRRVEV